MNNIEFNEPTVSIKRKTAKEKGIIGWLMRTGYVKDVKTANLILIGVIILMLAITFLVVTQDSEPTAEPTATTQQ